MMPLDANKKSHIMGVWSGVIKIDWHNAAHKREAKHFGDQLYLRLGWELSWRDNVSEPYDKGKPTLWTFHRTSVPDDKGSFRVDLYALCKAVWEKFYMTADDVAEHGP